jgi:hypothetical protein
MALNIKFENHQELYKVSVSTEKMQVWKGWTISNEVFCAYGQLGGKIQTQSYKAEGKNLGRSNETSDIEQACVELQAMYESQILNKHYRVTKEDAIEFANSNREPRKVTNYKDRWNKMSDRLLTSVKKDGSRACVIEGQLYSKIGRPEEIKVDHLRAVVEELGTEATFDCEIYAEGLSLQRIRSAWLKPTKTEKEIIKIAKDRAKGKGEDLPTPDGNVELSDAVKYLGYNPNDDAYQLKFWVFDIPDNTKKTAKQRQDMMRSLKNTLESRKLGIYFEWLFAYETNSHEERMQILEEVCAEGSEGLVHYEIDGLYEFGKRSTNTAKSKPRYDSEARVLNVTKDRSGQGVLHLQACDTLDNVKFKAKIKGDAEFRSFDNMVKHIGEWVTFSYEDLSDKGVPTKPVAERFRECDSEGNPLS